MLRIVGLKNKLTYALCTCLQVRQYAALLLRRKFLKAKQWNSVPAEISQR